MRFFIADAFTDRPFGGNAAGVALVEDFPPEDYMKALDAELHFSETAFVKPLDETRFHLRFFTPTEEVELCGHASVAAFSVLRDEGIIPPGEYRLLCAAGELGVSVGPDRVYLEMAPPRVVKGFSPEERAELYAACGLDAEEQPGQPAPLAVSTGLTDIMLPVRDRALLDRLQPDMERIAALSRVHGVLSFHVFAPGQGEYLAFCRDFAPVCGIPEEAATGTANGALTHYLDRLGLVRPGEENRILQGVAMGRPSVVCSRRETDGRIRIGGSAHILLRGELSLPE